MASAKQVSANRENAQKSTGPQSEAGKEASSRNSFRHGLSAHVFRLLDWEIPERFDALKQAFEAEHQPATVTEHVLVETMVQQYWLAQRSLCLQTNVMAEDLSEGGIKAMNTLSRYHAQHQRHFQQALAQLQKLRAEKRKAEIGFVSQKAAEAEETRRAAAETRKAEEHKITMEIKRQRCDREKSLTTMAAIKAADKMHESLPPNRQELAAEMPQKAA